MADRVKGITIQINGDTTKLSDSLKKVNREINDTQSALRDVEKLLKLDPKNTELLAQKQELLKKAIGDTSDKLNQLKAAQEQMKAEGVDQNSKAYQGLQREIASTEQSLKQLQDASKSLNDEMNKSVSISEKMAEATKKIADGAGTVAEKTKKVSLAAGGALTALAGMGIKAAKDADDLNALAKQTGLSTEALQKMQYASDLVDVDVETITGAVKKMKKSLDSNAKAFEEIGVATKDANGEYRDTEDIFNDVLEALSKIENETERDIKAMDIFGKSADDLAGIIDDGGTAMKALGDEAKNKGLIVSQEDLDKANQLNDTLDTLKATVGGSLGQAAVSVAEALTPVIEMVAAALTKVAEVISTLSPETVQIIAVVLAAVAAISPIAGIISGIMTAISAIIPVITAINAVIAANPVVLVIMGIVAAVAALVAAGVALYKNWDKIKEAAQKLVENIKNTFNNIKEFVLGFVEKAKNWGKDLIDNMVQGIKDKINAVKDAVKGVADKIKGFLGFSEPEEGPLSNFHTYMPDMIDLMKKGINENLYKLNQPLDALASKVGNNAQVEVNYNDSAITGSLETINDSIKAGGLTDVKITLTPDIQNLFRVLKVEQSREMKAAGV